MDTCIFVYSLMYKPLLKVPYDTYYSRLCIFKLISVVSVLRSQVGGRLVGPWSLFTRTQVFQHGLWCQVNSASNGGMGSNIGDMFYSTGNGPDDFTIVPTKHHSNNHSSIISILYKRGALEHHPTVVRPLVWTYASLVRDPHQQTV